MFVYTYIEIFEIALIVMPNTTIIDVTAGIVKATWHY